MRNQSVSQLPIYFYDIHMDHENTCRAYILACETKTKTHSLQIGIGFLVQNIADRKLIG